MWLLTVSVVAAVLSTAFTGSAAGTHVVQVVPQIGIYFTLVVQSWTKLVGCKMNSIS